MKYFELFEAWSRSGECGFLCHTVLGRDAMFNELIVPTKEEIDMGCLDGYGRRAWATHNSDLCYNFTPLRQNIVLFLAAMNNEL